MKEKELNKIIGRNIRKYRLIYNANHKEKLTQEKLGKRIGVSTSMIGALESENNSMGISIYNLYLISKELEVTIDKLVEEK